MNDCIQADLMNVVTATNLLILLLIHTLNELLLMELPTGFKED